MTGKPNLEPIKVDTKTAYRVRDGPDYVGVVHCNEDPARWYAHHHNGVCTKIVRQPDGKPMLWPTAEAAAQYLCDLPRETP